MMDDYCKGFVEQGQQVPDLTLVFNHRQNLDPRRYNKIEESAENEVAAILINNPDKYSKTRMLAVQLFDTGPHTIHQIPVTSCDADPLSYVLFFPCGDRGWVKDSPPWDLSFPPEPAQPTRRSRQADRPPASFADDEAEEGEEEENPVNPDNDDENANKRRSKTKKSFSLLDHYQYHLAFRPETGPDATDPYENFSPLHYGGRLFQQYCVDSFSKILERRVDQLRTPAMQKQLRADTYKQLLNYVQRRADRLDNVKAGKAVVMPSSFISGPRYMRKQYYNAMAVCREEGAPDLFITMTANSKWREIQEALEPGQTSNDRPYIVCRVFKLKLDELLKDLFERNIFGQAAGYAWTIEYQKRGLPHVHLLMILKNQADKPRLGSHIDRIISAEIPDQHTDPELYAAVTTHMIHGPYCHLTPNAICMNNPKCKGKCFRHFPFKPCEQSHADVDGYPEYRRRSACPVIEEHRGFTNVNTGWVVPHNPYLLVKFDTHINVEISTSIKSFKYIYKYVYKGGDKAEVCLRTIHEENETEQEFLDVDELKAYIDSTYLSPCEAYWRIAGYPTNAVSHVVEDLPIHLLDEQPVTFQEGYEADAISNAGDTKLTAFFKLNQGEGVEQEHRDLARVTLFHDIPKHFRWDASKKRWRARARKAPDFPSYNPNVSNKPVIGRMHQCSPKDIEKYSLRMLLLNIKGPESFADLLLNNDDPDNPTYYASFHEAAIHKGLLVDEREWHHCIN